MRSRSHNSHGSHLSAAKLVGWSDPPAAKAEIGKNLDWLAGLPMLGAPLRGARGPHTRATLERYGAQLIARSRPSSLDLQLALLDRLRALAPRTDR